MNHRTSSRIAVAAAFITASLAMAPVGAADPAEDYFLNELYKTHQKWYWPYGEGYIIDVAHGVCDDWTANVPYPVAVGNLSSAKRWTTRNTRYFIALSTASFCPEHYATNIPPEARLPDGK